MPIRQCLCFFQWLAKAETEATSIAILRYSVDLANINLVACVESSPSFRLQQTISQAAVKTNKFPNIPMVN